MEVIALKRDTLGWALIQYDWYPYKRENVETHTGSMSSEEEESSE